MNAGEVIDEARETSASTTGPVVAYTRARGGEDALEALLRSAGVPFTAEELSDASRWFSYDTASGSPRSSARRGRRPLTGDP